MSQSILLATICFLGMISPGPDFVLISRNSLKYPPTQALATAFGVIAGCGCHAAFCILGLSLVVTQSVLLFSIIKYVGASYLFYLGAKGLFFCSATILDLDQDLATGTISAQQAFVQGFFCNLLNPKLVVFLLSLFTQFIPANAEFSQKIFVAGIFFIESVLFWPLFALFFQQKTVRALYARTQRYIDGAFGLMLISMGIKVAMSKS